MYDKNFFFSFLAFQRREYNRFHSIQLTQKYLRALEYSTSCCLCKTEWTGYDVWDPEAKELSEQKIKEIKKLAYDGYCPFSVEQVLGE